MPVNKQHDEFYTLDLTSGWETQPGYPKGIQQKILSGALDENAAVAVRTWRLHDRSVRARLLGKKSSLCRAIWQSVTTIRGKGGVSFPPFTYACRPPRRCAWPVPIGRRISAYGNPLLRSGVRQTA